MYRTAAMSIPHADNYHLINRTVHIYLLIIYNKHIRIKAIDWNLLRFYCTRLTFQFEQNSSFIVEFYVVYTDRRCWQQQQRCTMMTGCQFTWTIHTHFTRLISHLGSFICSVWQMNAAKKKKSWSFYDLDMNWYNAHTCVYTIDGQCKVRERETKNPN